MKDHKPYFQRALKHFFPYDAIELNVQVDETFAAMQEEVAFAKHSSNPVDRRMEVAAYFLALIRVLDRRGLPFERIRHICTTIAREYVQPRNSFHAFLKKLPPKMIDTWFASAVIKAFAKRVGTLGHPEGFAVQVITDKSETYGLGYGFDIIECGICKLFARHDYKRFATILCDVDHITSELAGLELIRSSTIAYGAAKCDFRFKRKSASAS